MSINFDELENITNLTNKYKKTELLIVTKNRDLDDVKILVKKGYRLFGENRVQEAKKKFQLIKNDTIKLHLIGPLQTNKVKDALKIFDVIQSLDRIKLIDEIANYISKERTILTCEYYIQLNIGDEPQKAGVSPKNLKDIYDYAKNKKLNIVGLMCIPPFGENPKPFFNEMNNLKKLLNKNLKLSMGMSSDYKNAIEEGSDLVRIGSKIFN